MKLKLGLAALLGATVLFARDIIVPASELQEMHKILYLRILKLHKLL